MSRSILIWSMVLSWFVICGPVLGPASGIANSPWYVSETGSDVTGDGSLVSPYGSIQRGIVEAASGEEVIALPGTFTGPGNLNIDFMGKDITVRSLNNDPSECIIDCQGLGRGFMFQQNEGPASVLRGFTVTNGYASTLYGGGGIFMAGSDPEFLDDGASPTLEFCHINNNTGSGVCALGVLAEPTVTDCQFNGNTGAGFYSLYGQGSFSGCEFSNNSTNGFIRSSDGGEFSFSNCVIQNNLSNGILITLESGRLELFQCLVDGNQSDGIIGFSGEDGDVEIRESTISNNLGAGLNTEGGWMAVGVYDSYFLDNGLQGLVSGVWSGFIMDNVEVLDNGGLGIEMTPRYNKKATADPPSPSAATITVSNCTIGRNGGGGVGYNYGLEIDKPCVITDTHIFDNQGEGISLIIDGDTAAGAHLYIDGVTVAGNLGLGIFADVDSLSLTNVLVASNGLEAVDWAGAQYLASSCNNFFANAGGDWTGALADSLDSGGNITLDPRFCGPDNLEDFYSLREDSPCLAENNPGCGQIGAKGLGCGSEPLITSISDVGNDQGGQVRLVWKGSGRDDPAATDPVIKYGIYRRQDAFKVQENGPWSAKRIANWDFLLEVPARGDELYQTVVPTLCDSTVANGQCWSVFFVSAMTADHFEYFDSPPDSGYSIDNLNPDPPANLFVEYLSDRNTLNWDPSEEGDFSHFLVFKVEGEFAWPQSDDLPWAQVTTPVWEHQIDPGGSHAWDFWYFVVAVDFSGNRSEFSAPLGVTDAGPVGIRRFDLFPNIPNPFNPLTMIAFELAQPSETTVRIFDLSGKVVNTLINGSLLDAGEHGVSWNGRDAQGREAAAGVYFYNLEAGSFNKTRRMVLIK